MLNIENFIAKYVIKRHESMFQGDMKANEQKLSQGIKDKTVLVIGGAGSIGSSFIKALLTFQPRSLVVVDINENGLTELTRDLRSSSDFSIPQEYITYPMSYADDTFYRMFRAKKGFDIVANFSAHKHVRSEKDRYSVEALLKNNVINAKKLLDLLGEYPPQHFFCVSTDKAANPVNIMGASKKMMEDMIMAYSDDFSVTTARFANVAFSNGSLPYGFLERISKKQPISAPSDVTRYFVSPKESGEICLMACILGKSAEIYFPKLDQSQVMTFSQIATDLLTDMGYQLDHCKNDTEAREKAKKFKDSDKKYPVIFSKSDTTGEKDYEEFYTKDESVDMQTYHSLGIVSVKNKSDKKQIQKTLDKLSQLFEKEHLDKGELVLAIKEVIPNFEHKETGKYLDAKM